MRLLRDAKKVSSSALAAVILTALRSLLVLRILGPTIVGVWKAAMILYTVAGAVRFGVSPGMSLRIPVLEGQGKSDEADHTAAAAGFFLALVGLVFGFGVFCYSFAVKDPQFRIALRLMSIVVFVAQPHQFLRDLAMSHQLFPIRAKEILIASLTDFVGALVLSHYFGLVGIGTATILSISVPAIYLWFSQTLRYRFRFDPQRLKGLMRAGLSYSMVESATMFLRFMDVLIMTPLMGPTIVGYYAVSLLINDFAVFLTKLGVAEVVSPHLLNEYGKRGSHEQVAVFYEIPVRLFCYVLPPLLAVAALLLPGFVRLVLPQYIPGIAAAQITLWGIFFMAVHASVSSFLVAANRLTMILKVFGVLLVVCAAAQFLVIKAGFGLAGVAVASLATQVIMTSSELYVARRGCGYKRAEIAKYFGSLYLPLAISMVLTAAIQAVDLPAAVPFAGELALKVILATVCYLPVLAVYETRFSLLRTVRQPA